MTQLEQALEASLTGHVATRAELWKEADMHAAHAQIAAATRRPRVFRLVEITREDEDESAE